jgi:short-subunit dehydrogenase
MTAQDGGRPVALVTGASSGLGKIFAGLLAKSGHDVVLVARRESALTALAKETQERFAVNAHVVALDLARPGAARALFERTSTLGANGGALAVDVLINNAGFGKYGAFATSDMAVQSEMIATNITALTEITRLFLDGMVARKSGRIMQVASTAAFQPGPQMAVYYATKAYVLSFGEALWHELAGTGVTVTTLCPGPTRTEFMDVASYKLNAFGERAAMKADDVAEAGIAALMRGDRLCVAGAHNKLGVLGAQLAPRGVALRVAAALMNGRG